VHTPSSVKPCSTGNFTGAVSSLAKRDLDDAPEPGRASGVQSDRIRRMLKRFASPRYFPARLLFAFWLCTFVARPASACPNLAGHYARQWEDGTVDYFVSQTGCGRVEVKMSNGIRQVFIPDGKAHGKDIPVCQWAGEQLRIGHPTAHTYYLVDSAGDLHFSDGRTYPQCNGPCDWVAKRVASRKQ